MELESDHTGANSTLLAEIDESLGPQTGAGHGVHIFILVLASNELGTAK
jgi:hypothetical protein